jgi:hypothetical protein
MGDGFVSAVRRPVMPRLVAAPLRGSARRAARHLPTGSNDEAPANVPEADPVSSADA